MIHRPVENMDEIKQAVVLITANGSNRAYCFEESGRPARSKGSGFFIQPPPVQDDQAMYVMTCAHVVQDAKTFVVDFLSGTEKHSCNAEIVTFNPCHLGDYNDEYLPYYDLAILKILAEPTTVREIRYLKLAKFEQVKNLNSNSVLWSFGSPMDSQSMTSQEGKYSSLQKGLLQHTATISEGNSGGPLVLQSKNDFFVVGVNNSADVSDSGGKMCFAVPIYFYQKYLGGDKDDGGYLWSGLQEDAKKVVRLPTIGLQLKPNSLEGTSIHIFNVRYQEVYGKILNFQVPDTYEVKLSTQDGDRVWVPLSILRNVDGSVRSTSFEVGEQVIVLVRRSVDNGKVTSDMTSQGKYFYPMAGDCLTHIEDVHDPDTMLEIDKYTQVKYYSGNINMLRMLQFYTEPDRVYKLHITRGSTKHVVKYTPFFIDPKQQYVYHEHDDTYYCIAAGICFENLNKSHVRHPVLMQSVHGLPNTSSMDGHVIVTFRFMLPAPFKHVASIGNILKSVNGKQVRTVTEMILILVSDVFTEEFIFQFLDESEYRLTLKQFIDTHPSQYPMNEQLKVVRAYNTKQIQNE